MYNQSMSNFSVNVILENGSMWLDAGIYAGKMQIKVRSNVYAWLVFDWLRES